MRFDLTSDPAHRCNSWRDFKKNAYSTHLDHNLIQSAHYFSDQTTFKYPVFTGRTFYATGSHNRYNISSVPTPLTLGLDVETPRHVSFGSL